MPTIYQMNLADCRKECERQAEQKNAYEHALRSVIGLLAMPYDNVVDLEIRVKQILAKYGKDGSDA